MQELKNNNDIVQVISGYVKLRNRGRMHVGLCPFHSEKSPSFTVYESNQSYFCYGCGVGGDVISFIRQAENLGYVEAVRFLAERSGMTVPDDRSDEGEGMLKAKVLEINRALARYYFDCLQRPGGKDGLEYLHDRRLSNQTITKFGLGYAPDSWSGTSQFLKSKGYRDEDLLAAGVTAKGSRGVYDLFRGRVMFPIIDLRGNVIAFGGRILKQDSKAPKYLNTGDTPVFKKSRGLFAMNIAKASKRKGILLCEGYMDVIAVHQAGFDNAVATLGTALTGEQVRLLSQYTDTVTIAYDSDEAGQTATRRASLLFGEVGVKVRVLSMAGAKDPDEYIKKFGSERFSLLIDGAANVTEFEISKLRQQYHLENADEKLSFLQEFLGLMLKIQNPVERDVYLSRTATELEVQKSALETELEYRKKREAKKKKKDPGALRIYSEQMPQGTSAGEGGSGDTGHRALDIQRGRNIKYALAEDKLLTILLKYPEYYSHISGQITLDDFVTDRNRDLARILFPRLENGRSVELSMLGGECTLEQMSQLASLQASAEAFTYTVEDLRVYMETLLSRKEQKSRDEVARMSDDDLQAYINSLASKKMKK